MNGSTSQCDNDTIGPICFVTPEIGRWSTIGGLGVMVDELTQGLSALGQDVIVISPYYDRNRKGESNYLIKDEIFFSHKCNIDVYLDKKYTFGVHYGIGKGIKYFFIHNYEIFPKPYPNGSNEYTIKQISLFSKGVLELLCNERILPSLIVTNDWFTGLVAAYSKNGCFGETFKGTTFFHICHNLETAYEGRIYLSESEGIYEHIHRLPNEWLIDPNWSQRIINPSRCAIIMSDQWGTVSNSYKEELLNTSPLAVLLKKHKAPFAFPNGIYKKNRERILNERVGNNRNETKAYIQRKYFGYNELNQNVPVFSFVGRITEQKGVYLILEIVEEIITLSNHNINILIGGMGNRNDPYVIKCIEKINYLKGKYPNCFWANPDEFFTDGPAVNFGSDFGLMPSKFEPGGIVQHEFFIAKTPVIAYKTGGLKDTVFEFNWDSNQGNGIVFDHYDTHNLKNCIMRAISLFNNKDKFNKCRENAYNSAIDVADVAKAWCSEFYRLKGKVFDSNKKKENKSNKHITPTTYSALEKLSTLKQGKTNLFMVKKQEIEKLISLQYKKISYLKSLISNSQNKFPISTNDNKVIDKNGKDIVFTFKTNDAHNTVQLCGSFGNWQVRYPLTYDSNNHQWTTQLKIKKGIHYYKYLVDGQWMINNDEEIHIEDDGSVNNMIII